MEERKKAVATRKRGPERPKKIQGKKISIATREAQNAIEQNRTKTPKDLEVIHRALGKHFIFTSLTEENLSAIVDAMKFYTINAREMLFEQGQPAKNFFVLVSGKLEVQVNGNQVNLLEPGSGFGELALLHDTNRSASIIALEKCGLWGVNRKTFREAVESVNALNFLENKEFINNVPLLQLLTSQQKDAMVAALDSHKFETGDWIIKEGDSGDLFYIIKEGTCQVSRGGEEIVRLGKGDFFGEMALLYDVPRAATVTALQQTKCISLGRDNLQSLLGGDLQNVIYRNIYRITLERSQSLNKLTAVQIDKIITLLQVKTLERGEVVVPAGSPYGNKLWIVLKGKVVNKKTGVPVAEKFCIIGDRQLSENLIGEFDSDLVATSTVCISELTTADLENCIGGKYHDIQEQNDALQILAEVQLLRGLTIGTLQELIKRMTIQKYQPGEIIVKQHNEGDQFFIVKDGKVDVIKDNIKLRTITKLDYFGERALILNNFRTATVIAQSMVNVWVLNRADFFELIESNIRDQLLKKIEQQDIDVQLDQLVPVKLLGNGMFGSVILAGHTTSDMLFAVKSVPRTKIEAYDISDSLVLERNVLLQLDHTFILKLFKTFKDSERIYFLTEFVQGCDLFDTIRELGLLTDEDSRFYAACILLILEHLHDREIIYRDLKPENVMVDDQGYPRLIDFGTAKIIESRTYTIVGTPHYMAPEIITGKGYDYTADYWSLGVVLFEFMCGGVPFGEEEEDPYEIYEAVLGAPLRYPNFVPQPFPAAAIIEQLLDRNPGVRTGGGIGKLKEHVWFAGYPWNDCICRKVRTPHVPQVVPVYAEVEQAKRMPYNLRDFISTNEEPVDSSFVSARPKQVASDWDAEFQFEHA